MAVRGLSAGYAPFTGGGVVTILRFCHHSPRERNEEGNCEWAVVQVDDKEWKLSEPGVLG